MQLMILFRVHEMGSIIGMLEDMEGKKTEEETKIKVDELFRSQCYKTFFTLSLTMRPNNLELLSSQTLSREVLEIEGKARANPTGEDFRCFLFG
jgi:hypothetical protein